MNSVPEVTEKAFVIPFRQRHEGEDRRDSCGEMGARALQAELEERRKWAREESKSEEGVRLGGPDQRQIPQGSRQRSLDVSPSETGSH